MAAESRIGVLASGSGSTFEAVQEAIVHSELSYTEIAFVICNNGQGKVGVWERADRLGVPIHHISNKTQDSCTVPMKNGRPVAGTISYEASERITTLAQKEGVDMLVGLGYMKRVIGAAIEQIPIMNSHPGPLPATAGLHGTGVQIGVMHAGLMHSGPTTHWMDRSEDELGLVAYDSGAQIGHERVPVTAAMISEWEADGTVTILQNEVMRIEKLHVPRWISLALEQVHGAA